MDPIRLIREQEREHERRHAPAALKRRDFDGFIACHGRPRRLVAFLKIHERLPDPEYWRLLGEVWIDAEGTCRDADIWNGLLGSPRRMRECFMPAKDRETFAALPDRLTVYRGCTKDNRIGRSWTLDESVAGFFARRFAGVFDEEPQVRRIVILKSAAVGYLSERNEAEVVLRKPR